MEFFPISVLNNLALAMGRSGLIFPPILTLRTCINKYCGWQKWVMHVSDELCLNKSSTTLVSE